eukprot:6214827-Pleurochrysis_carterae.AAC.9
MADTGGAHGADNDFRNSRLRFKLTMQDKSKQFLGMNIDMRDDGGSRFLPPRTSRQRRTTICQGRSPTTQSTRHPPRRNSSRTTRSPCARYIPSTRNYKAIPVQDRRANLRPSLRATGRVLQNWDPRSSAHLPDSRDEYMA